MNLLIFGDPCGITSGVAVKNGYKPEDIFVWENDVRHYYAIKQINDKITIISDADFGKLNMRFHSNIGNPPYLKNLHLEFLLKGLELSDNVSLVHPSGWLFRSTRKIEMQVRAVLKNRVRKLELFNGNAKFPDARFGCPLVITTAVKHHTGPIELVYGTTGNRYYIDSLDDMPTGFWEPSAIHLETVEKYKKLTQTDSINSLLKKYSGKGFSISTPRVCGNQTKKAEDFISYDFFTFFYRKSEIFDINPKNKVFITSSEAERDSLISYLKTKVARFGLSINKISQDAHISRYLESVPLPPLDREWTEKSIMDYYKFSEEQRNLINTFIADYYV